MRVKGGVASCHGHSAILSFCGSAQAFDQGWGRPQEGDFSNRGRAGQFSRPLGFRMLESGPGFEGCVAQIEKQEENDRGRANVPREFVDYRAFPHCCGRGRPLSVIWATRTGNAGLKATVLMKKAQIIES